jgi:hypothetical protein
MGGGVGDFLFGKKPKPETSESGNHAWEPIKSALSPALGYVTGGGNMMGSLLGIPGMGSQTEGLKNFANSGGMQFLLNEGTDAINSNFYARGLGKSGAAMKGLEKYRSGLASTYLNDYMKNLMGFSNLGLGAAGVMSDAGRWSKGIGQQAGKGGALPYMLQAASMIPGISDRRVKKNVKLIGEYANGLPKYSFEFVEGLDLPKGRFEGPMADEVKRLIPDAYLPNYYGKFDGVDYAKLGN